MQFGEILELSVHCPPLTFQSYLDHIFDILVFFTVFLDEGADDLFFYLGTVLDCCVWNIERRGLDF